MIRQEDVRESERIEAMIKVFSYGGGVQSTAALVLAAQGEIDYSTFLFCNVGDDSENPETLTYMQDVAIPYAREHNITLITLERRWQMGERAGTPVTLYGLITKPGSKSIGIPVRMSNGAPGNRSCTVDFKIEVVDRYLREHNAKEQGATVGLGISLDEWQRMRTGVDPEKPWKHLEYPLIDKRLSRQDCINIIERANLPVPPKSSCYFCPYHTKRVWQEMRQKQPNLFKKACDLETLINVRRGELGKDNVWLTNKNKPLAQVTTDLVQDSLFEDEDDVCESGYCMM